jgi:hypothetical protein
MLDRLAVEAHMGDDVLATMEMDMDAMLLLQVFDVSRVAAGIVVVLDRQCQFGRVGTVRQQREHCVLEFVDSGVVVDFDELHVGEVLGLDIYSGLHFCVPFLIGAARNALLMQGKSQQLKKIGKCIKQAA